MVCLFLLFITYLIIIIEVIRINKIIIITMLRKDSTLLASVLIASKLKKKSQKSKINKKLIIETIIEILNIRDFFSFSLAKKAARKSEMIKTIFI